MEKIYYFEMPNGSGSNEANKELLSAHPGLVDGSESLEDIVASYGVDFNWLDDRDYGFEAAVREEEVKKLPNFIWASEL
jgi:hypothetical protein